MRKVSVDDCFFYFAAVTLIVGSAIYFTCIKTIYYFETTIEKAIAPSSDLIQRTGLSATYGSVAQVLFWATIYAVKLSFLFYFRTLVRQLPKLERWWWTVLIVLTPLAVIFIFGTFIVCPHENFAIISRYMFLLVQSLTWWLTWSVKRSVLPMTLSCGEIVRSFIVVL